MIKQLQLKLLGWLTRRHLLDEPCNAFGSYANNYSELRLCSGRRWHTDSHCYERTMNLGYRRPPTIYVTAQSWVHFNHWCRMSGIDSNSNMVRFIHHPEMLYGIDGTSAIFVFYETWHDHPKSKEIFERIQMLRRKSGQR